MIHPTQHLFRVTMPANRLSRPVVQVTSRSANTRVLLLRSIMLLGLLYWCSPAFAQQDTGEAKSESEMKEYVQAIRNTEITFSMVPIPGGEFLMGSPESEADRKEDEGPQHKVKLEPFW